MQPIDFRMVVIGKSLKYDGAVFSGGISLNGATTKRLVVGEFPNDEFSIAPRKVDLRGFTFEEFIGSKYQAVALLQAQAPETFSASPYIQLEQYYRNIGDEVAARDMYYRARHNLRRNAMAPNGITEWSYSRQMADWCYKWMVGYGVRPWRLFAMFCYFVFVGTVLFWPDHALVEVQATPTEAQSAAPRAYEGSSAYTPEAKLADRLLYSLDLLVPTANVLGFDVGDFGVSGRWAPNGSTYETYALFHATAGYVLIALFILMYTGALRRF